MSRVPERPTSVLSLVDDLIDRVHRAGLLLEAIDLWAGRPDAGEPGQQIKRLLDAYRRQVCSVDLVEEARRAQGVSA